MMTRWILQRILGISNHDGQQEGQLMLEQQLAASLQSSTSK